tara:strand:+ start:52 stop:183 length:132 start_codon:yes stop_codon:yes gene_type:complete
MEQYINKKVIKVGKTSLDYVQHRKFFLTKYYYLREDKAIMEEF